MNHPLTKLCEKLFDEHRLMDFHRCVLDVDYRKQLLNELAHNYHTEKRPRHCARRTVPGAFPFPAIYFSLGKVLFIR